MICNLTSELKYLLHRLELFLSLRRVSQRSSIARRSSIHPLAQSVPVAWLARILLLIDE